MQDQQCAVCGLDRILQKCEDCGAQLCSRRHLRDHQIDLHSQDVQIRTKSPVQSQQKMRTPSSKSQYQDMIARLQLEAESAVPEREYQLHQEILRLSKKIFGAQSQELREAFYNHAKCSLKNNQLESAQESLQQILHTCLKISEKMLAPSEASFAVEVCNLLGNCNIQLGQPENALQNYEQCEQILNQFQEVKLKCDLSGLYMNKGLSHFYLGNLTTAEQYYNKAIQINDHILGDENVTQQNAKVYTNLAVLNDFQGKIEAARTLYTKAFKIRQKVLDANHLELLELQYNINCIDLQQGKDVIQNLETLAEKFKIILGPDHPKIGSLQYSLGVAYQNKHQFKKALNFFNNVIRIWEPYVGREDQAFSNVLQRINKIKSNMKMINIQPQ